MIDQAGTSSAAQVLQSENVDCCVEQETWQPLIRPAYLEVLWQKLLTLWDELGFVPKDSAANGALQQYVKSGQYPPGTASLCIVYIVYMGAAWQMQGHVAQYLLGDCAMSNMGYCILLNHGLLCHHDWGCVCLALLLVSAAAGSQTGSLQELFGCFLSLNHLPFLGEITVALGHSRALKATVGTGATSDDATLLLSLALPSVPLSAVSLLGKLL